MPNSYGCEKVKCPFYKEDTCKTIKCESIFATNIIHIFENNQLKRKHKEEYCNTYNFCNCLHYRRLMKKYKLDPDEFTGPWIEILLYNYSRY